MDAVPPEPRSSSALRWATVAAATFILALGGCEAAAEPSLAARVPSAVTINGVEGQPVRWCTQGDCIDLGIGNPDDLPEGWMPQKRLVPCPDCRLAD